MIRFFRKFFQQLFGGSSPSTNSSGASTLPASSPEPEPVGEPVEPEPEPVEEPAPASQEAALVLRLERYSFGAQDTLGKLHLPNSTHYTLENPSKSNSGPDKVCIPAGTYPISLRRSGGKDVAYQFRFPEIHAGILTIQDVPGFPYAHLHIGNEASYTYGSIVLGTQVRGESSLDSARQIIYSEKAYLDLYQQVLPYLQRKEIVHLEIQDQPTA